MRRSRSNCAKTKRIKTLATSSSGEEADGCSSKADAAKGIEAEVQRRTRARGAVKHKS